MAKSYLRKNESMRRLIAYVRWHQERYGVAPLTYYGVAAAIGTSPTQAKRLLARAEKGGILRRVSPDSLRYEEILHPPHLPGVARLAVIECRWSQRIEWVDTGERGYWLDRAGYQIGEETGGMWAVVFPERPRNGAIPSLRLNEHAFAFVRRCRFVEVRERCWYLIEIAQRVTVARCVKRNSGSLMIREGLGSTKPDRVARRDIRAIAEIIRVNSRPPEPSQG